MPVYEYRCSNDHHYERTEGFDAPREHACSVCGSTARRQISLPAVIFKGPGFYSTDNRRSGGSNGKSGDTEASASSGSGPKDGASSSKVEAATAD